MLEDALERFHDNKQVFINLGIRNNFNLPKLHSLKHYMASIELFGTTDNYNTESSERLHIDLAKNAYRATNRRDEYPQMVQWLERKEKIYRHDLFVKWCLSGRALPPDQLPQLAQHTHIQMTKWPTLTAVPLPVLVTQYGAHDFRNELAIFVSNKNHPGLTALQIRNTARNIILPFQRLPVFHKIKFWNTDPYSYYANHPRHLMLHMYTLGRRAT